MRTAYILAVICFTTVYATDPNKPIIACARESNLDLADGYLNKVLAGTIKPSEDFYRFVACLYANSEYEEKNIHDYYMREFISRIDTLGYFENESFTREDVENVANRCAREGLNDADYLKCVKIFEPPFFSLFQ